MKWPNADDIMKGRERSVFGTYAKRVAQDVQCTDCRTMIPEELAVKNHGACNPCLDIWMSINVNKEE